MNDGRRLEFVGTFKPVENTETLVIPKTIKYIAGRLNSCNTTYYWEIDEDEDFEIGDYAIVENMNDFDLIKIVGVVETVEKYTKFITNNRINKKVIQVIDRQDIRED